MRVDAGLENEGALIGNNLKAHLEGLEKDMRDAAADLDIEKAANLRDEIKRLQETELLVADDPLARNAGIENTKSSRARAARRGKAGGRASDSRAKNESLFHKPDLDELPVGRTEKPVGSGMKPEKRPLPRSKTGKPGQRGGFKANKRGR